MRRGQISTMSVTWHCFNHMLELAVSDATKSTTQVNHFKIFLDTLFALYSQSPRCQRELVSCASELDVRLNRIGRVLSVHWVASSCHTVMAVWQSYAALHEHFIRKSTDPILSMGGKGQNFQVWQRSWRAQFLSRTWV